MAILQFVPLLVSLAFLMRTALIMTGILKGPILHTFEKYGDMETVYYPLPSLLFWGGIFVITCGFWLAAPLRSWAVLVMPGILLIAGAYYAYTHPELAQQHPQIFMSYPSWYFELRERTTRYERRRIAYMWLGLPYRMRMAFNGNDHAFNQWADLVIIATIPFDEDIGDWRDIPTNGF
jgi:hypothetical protein